jgi:hypothetical protein
MAVVTELKNGMWFVHWFTNASSSIQNIQCGQTTLQLYSTLVNSQVNLTLTATQGKEFYFLNDKKFSLVKSRELINLEI